MIPFMSPKTLSITYTHGYALTIFFIGESVRFHSIDSISDSHFSDSHL